MKTPGFLKKRCHPSKTWSGRNLTKKGFRGKLTGLRYPWELPMNPQEIFCPNIACPARGQTGKGNIHVHSQKDRRFICDVCQDTFATSKGTIFYRLRHASDKNILIKPAFETFEKVLFQKRSTWKWDKIIKKHHVFTLKISLSWPLLPFLSVRWKIFVKIFRPKGFSTGSLACFL